MARRCTSSGSKSKERILNIIKLHFNIEKALFTAVLETDKSGTDTFFIEEDFITRGLWYI